MAASLADPTTRNLRASSVPPATRVKNRFADELRANRIMQLCQMRFDMMCFRQRTRYSIVLPAGPTRNRPARLAGTLISPFDGFFGRETIGRDGKVFYELRYGGGLLR